MTMSSPSPANTPATPPHGTPQHVPPPAGVPAVLWGHTNTLAAVPGEVYQGRITAELYGQASSDQAIYRPGTVFQQKFIEQALGALRGKASFAATPSLWPAAPITGGSGPNSGPYLGRVVIELWSSTANVAVTVVGGKPEELVRRVIEDWTMSML